MNALTKSDAAISGEDRELVHQLLDDVGVIGRLLTPRPQPAQIRATFAPILRRWIAEGGFFKAQKLILPRQVTFLFGTNPQSVKLAKAGVYEHWMAVISFDSVGVSSAQVASKHIDHDGRPGVAIDHGLQTRPIAHRAHEFFGQKMFFWKGQFYTREDVVKMHANALGGVHLDFRRAAAQPSIIAIKNYFGFEIKPNTCQMLMGDEIAEGRDDPARRPNIYDATELVVSDTARIFAEGVRSTRNLFEAVLN